MLIHDYLRSTKLVTKDGVLSVDKNGVIKGLSKSKEKDYETVADITYKKDTDGESTPKKTTVKRASKEESSKEEAKGTAKKESTPRPGRPRKRINTKA